MRGAANTTIRLSEVPVAAYVVFPLDHFDGDIPLLQVFRRRQAGGTRTDNAIAVVLVCHDDDAPSLFPSEVVLAGPR